MLSDIPIGTGDVTNITTVAKVADIGLGVIGIDTPKELEALANPIGFIADVLFGGESDRDINLSALNVPTILSDAGISIPGAGGGSFDSFRDAAVPLAQQIQAISPAISKVRQDFRDIGLFDVAAEIGAEEQRLTRTPTGHADAIAINQSKVNLIATSVYRLRKYESDRKNFLIENPTAGNILRLFVKESPTNEREITNNFFDLFRTSENAKAQTSLSTLTGRSETYLNNLIISNSPKKATATVTQEPERPQVPLPSQNINLVVPPIKVILQQPQSTLGTSSFPQNPTQPANPQTSANWWQSLKTNAASTVNTANRIASAAQFPFFIRDTFFNTIEDLQTVFFGESGSLDFDFPNFPESQPPQQQFDLFSLLERQKKIKDQGFSVEELDGNSSFFAQLSPTTKTLLPILLGLITTIIILKKRGIKT